MYRSYKTKLAYRNHSDLGLACTSDDVQTDKPYFDEGKGWGKNDETRRRGEFMKKILDTKRLRKLCNIGTTILRLPLS